MRNSSFEDPSTSTPRRKSKNEELLNANKRRMSQSLPPVNKSQKVGRRVSINQKYDSVNFFDSTDDTGYEQELFDSSISSIENYHPGTSKLPAISKRKSKGPMGIKNRPLQENKSGNTNSGRNSNKNFKAKPYDPKKYENSSLPNRASQKDAHRSQEMSHDEVTKAESYEKFYRRMSVGGGAEEGIRCPDCSVAFKSEVDKKRHFKVELIGDRLTRSSHSTRVIP